MAVDPKQVQTVFLKAAELPPAERSAFLERECAGDAELREHVEGFLASHDQPDGYLDRPLLPVGFESFAFEHDDRFDDLAPGARVGPYRVVELLGEGGMGTVWVAEQEVPVKRRVALKIVRSGLNSAQVVARFEAERQALALMDHPNIARIIDAGTVDSGQRAVDSSERGKKGDSSLFTTHFPLPTARRPYFVMELIEGVPVTTYSDAHRLSVRERLELFVPVCRAIEHAHQKGIIHRDLKPTNVLVCAQDGKPVPKVIDFGIAKAVNQKLSADTIHTGVRTVIGSVQYMSPEQAEPGALDVDTRSDVYGLGVLLYELLTGSTPVESGRTETRNYLDALRLIREEEPPAPSTRLTGSKNLPALAAQRRTEPDRLAKEVRGELDWIVMKCLEKDRARRYGAASGLARDLEHYLRDEPVEAGPPSRTYRLKKFVRRNRGAVFAAGAVVAALVLGIVGTTVGMVRAVNEEAKAKKAAEDERAARGLAERRLGQVEKAADVLSAIFSDLQPGTVDPEGRSFKLILASRLKYAETQLDGEAIGDPLTVARLEDAIGSSYLALGYFRKAIVLLEHARKTRAARLGVRDPDTLATMQGLGQAYHEAGRLKEAAGLYEETLRLRREVFGPKDPRTLRTMNNLAVAVRELGRYSESLRLFEGVHRLMVEVHGPLHEDTLLAQSNVASAYRDAGRLSDAIRLFQETLCQRLCTLPPDHPEVLRSMSLLASAYSSANRQEEALALHEEALRLQKEVLGPLHPETLGSMGEIAVTFRRMNRLKEAITRGEEALKLRRDVLGREHPHTLIAMNNLAVTYDVANRPDDAMKLFAEVLPLATQSLGPKHPDTLRAMLNLGAAYREAGEPAKALPLLKDALELQNVLAPDHPDALTCADFLSGTYLDLDQPAKALAVLEPLVSAQRKRFEADELNSARFLARFGRELIVAEQRHEAEKLLNECLEIRRKHEPDAWTTFEAELFLACSLQERGELVAAEKHFLHGYEGLKRQESTLPPKGKVLLPDAAGRLSKLYAALKQPDDVAKWEAERARYLRKKSP